MNKVRVEEIINIINSLGEIKVSVDQIDNELFDLGMDSILFIQMVVALEEFYDCEIPDSKLLISELGTIRKIYVILNESI